MKTQLLLIQLTLPSPTMKTCVEQLAALCAALKWAEPRYDDETPRDTEGGAPPEIVSFTATVTSPTALITTGAGKGSTPEEAAEAAAAALAHITEKLGASHRA